MPLDPAWVDWVCRLVMSDRKQTEINVQFPNKLLVLEFKDALTQKLGNNVKITVMDWPSPSWSVNVGRVGRVEPRVFY